MTIEATVHDEDNNELTLLIPDGWSLMEALRDQRLVAGECGGMQICGTCHIIVDAEQFDTLSPITDDEEAMLCEIDTRTATSRLSCMLRGDDCRDLRFQVAPSE